jgi:hypothetical protein
MDLCCQSDLGVLFTKWEFIVDPLLKPPLVILGLLTFYEGLVAFGPRLKDHLLEDLVAIAKDIEWDEEDINPANELPYFYIFIVLGEEHQGVRDKDHTNLVEDFPLVGLFTGIGLHHREVRNVNHC